MDQVEVVSLIVAAAFVVAVTLFVIFARPFGGVRRDDGDNSDAVSTFNGMNTGAHHGHHHGDTGSLTDSGGDGGPD